MVDFVFAANIQKGPESALKSALTNTPNSDLYIPVDSKSMSIALNSTPDTRNKSYIFARKVTRAKYCHLFISPPRTYHPMAMRRLLLWTLYWLNKVSYRERF